MKWLVLGQLAGLLHFPTAAGYRPGKYLRYFGIEISSMSTRTSVGSIFSITSLFPLSLFSSLRRFLLFLFRFPAGLCFLFDYDVRLDSHSGMELFLVWEMFLMEGTVRAPMKEVTKCRIEWRERVLSTCHMSHKTYRPLRGLGIRFRHVKWPVRLATHFQNIDVTNRVPVQFSQTFKVSITILKEFWLNIKKCAISNTLHFL